MRSNKVYQSTCSKTWEYVKIGEVLENELLFQIKKTEM